jgi:HSP20 family molecular chaperone IbpA
MTEATTRTPRTVYTPPTDIYENETGFVLVADLPGVDENSVEITLQDDVLTIVGRTHERAPEGYRRTYAEFEPGDYERSFVLSDRADSAGIEATVKNGVLSVKVPKAKPAQRKIPIQGAS